MALIICFECSEEISDTAKSCPHCGAGKSRECHECYERISEDLETCPNCGAPRELEGEDEETVAEGEDETKPHWAVQVKVGLLMLMGLIYLLSKC